jgi:undecaprenyl-diphosphatase
MNVKKWAYPLAILTLVVFLVMAFNFKTPSFEAFDERIASALGGNELLGLFHYLGETILVVIIAVILLLYLSIRQQNYRGMLFVLMTFAGGTIINNLIKNYVQRPRPEIIDQLTSYSFPSGHSQMSILYLFTLAYIFSEITTSKKKTTIVWIVATILFICIGLSRIAESRHFATDVLAGWSLGYTWFTICVIWYEARKRKFKRLNS